MSIERISRTGSRRPFSSNQRSFIQRKLAPADIASRFPRIDKGYAELTIVRRQQGADRGDLLLARQFAGDGSDAASEEVWAHLRDGTLGGFRLVKWVARNLASGCVWQNVVPRSSVVG